LDGEVWINGKLCYSRVAPKITESHVQIWRLEEGRLPNRHTITTIGPHIVINSIGESLLVNVPRDDLISGASYSFSGPYLGHIAMLNGYPSVDHGTQMRAIRSLNFEIKIQGDAFHIELSGATGKLIPSTCGIYEVQDDRILEFKIWFDIPRHSLSLITKSKQVGEILGKRLEA